MGLLASPQKSVGLLSKSSEQPDWSALKLTPKSPFSINPQLDKFASTPTSVKKGLLQKVTDTAIAAAKNFAAPMIERGQAIADSIATKSLDPLRKSFAAQNKEMRSPEGLMNMVLGVSGEGAANSIEKALAQAAKKTAAPVERGFLQSVKDAAPELKARVSGQYIPRSTDELAIQAKNLIKDNITTAENLAKTGTSDKAVATAAELIKHYTESAKGAADKATADVLYDKAADVANTIAHSLTDQGRAVQAASIMGRLTPEGIVRFAARDIQKYNTAIDVAKSKLGGFNTTAMLKKIPELTGEQLANLTKKAEQITAMPDGIEKAMA